MHGRDWIDYTTLICTTLGVIVVAWYTFIARKQARLTEMAFAETRRSNEATGKSNAIAEKSLELGRRAWLVIAGMNPPFSGAPGELATSSVLLENIGGVPAIVIRYGWELVAGDLPERLDLSPERTSRGGAIIFGDKKELLESTRRLTPKEYSIIANEKGADEKDHLYLYWVIEYSDCFEKIRSTAKCWRHQNVPPMENWVETAEPQCNRLE
jgi:hypothetical protein